MSKTRNYYESHVYALEYLCFWESYETSLATTIVKQNMTRRCHVCCQRQINVGCPLRMITAPTGKFRRKRNAKNVFSYTAVFQEQCKFCAFGTFAMRFLSVYYYCSRLLDPQGASWTTSEIFNLHMGCLTLHMNLPVNFLTFRSECSRANWPHYNGQPSWY